MAAQKKIKITPEIAAQLRGLLPITAEARRKFIPKAFLDGSLPPEFVPSFTLRAMTKAEKQAYSSSFAEGSAKSYEECLFDCIESAENLYDLDTMEPVDFDLPYFMEMHPVVRNEIASEILAISCLLPIEALGLR
jgi:hypothetical protein